MRLHPPELEAKLSRLAAEQGRASEALAVEAVERMVNYGQAVEILRILHGAQNWP